MNTIKINPKNANLYTNCPYIFVVLIRISTYILNISPQYLLSPDILTPLLNIPHKNISRTDIMSAPSYLTHPTQASPQHLLSAAIMSAPAALAMAKLSFPETQVSQTKTEQDVYMEKTLET